jgi:hypothetical protein
MIFGYFNESRKLLLSVFYCISIDHAFWVYLFSRKVNLFYLLCVANIKIHQSRAKNLRHSCKSYRILPSCLKHDKMWERPQMEGSPWIVAFLTFPISHFALIKKISL